MDISIIVAVANNGVIGKNNDLIWHLPSDLKYFKATTTGHNIVMGRNTFESISGGRLLPNRITTIITRNKQFVAPEGALVAHSLKQALHQIQNENEVFICGGAQIYELALPFATKLYITKVNADFEGDTFFPEIDLSQWKLQSETEGILDEKNTIPHTFCVYTK